MALAVSCLVAHGLRHIWGRTFPDDDPLQPVGEDGGVSRACQHLACTFCVVAKPIILSHRYFGLQGWFTGLWKVSSSYGGAISCA